MWIAELDHDELLGYFQGAVSPKVREARDGSLPPPTSGNYLVAWRVSPAVRKELPRLIVGDDARLQELLAWLSAYVPDLSPFTAFCRVLNHKEAGTWLGGCERLPGELVRDGFIGLILAETYCRSLGHSLSGISPFACLRSLSFLGSRSHAIGFLKEDFERMFEAWLHLRQIEGVDEDDRLLSHLRVTWTMLTWLGDLSTKELASKRLGSEFDSVHQALHEVSRTGDISESTWAVLTQALPDARHARSELKKTREDRVLAFERALSAAGTVQSSPVLLPFVLGYLASRIAPGSLDHLALLRPLLSNLPGAVLWYGLLAGMSEQATVRTSFRGLGARIAREVYRREDPLEPPRADLAYRELLVLQRGSRWRGRVRTMSKESANVEVFPGVYTYVALPDEGGKPRPEQGKLFTDSAVTEAESSHLADLRGAVERAKRDLDEVLRRAQKSAARKPHQGSGSSKAKRGKQD